MIRNLKALGLALVAVFAMSAMTASAASASGVLTSDGPVTLDGVDTGEFGSGANALTAFGNEVECENSTYTGHKYNVTPHTFIESGESTATITPNYKNGKCVAAGFPATVQTAGCDYVFHIGEVAKDNEGNPISGTYEVTADLVCEGGSVVYVEAFAGESHGFRVCTDTITSQSGLEGTAHLTNTEGDIDLTGDFEGIVASQSGLCGAGNTEEGVLHTDVTITGTNEEGGATSISISG